MENLWQIHDRMTKRFFRKFLKKSFRDGKDNIEGGGNRVFTLASNASKEESCSEKACESDVVESGDKSDFSSDEKSQQFFIPETIDNDWIFEKMVPLLKKEELDPLSATTLVSRAVEVFHPEPLLLDLHFSGEVETVVVGDIHGQFKDLCFIFEKFGRPGPTKRFIFNGDIVDRGSRSTACLLLLLALKVAGPSFIYITRGNHETRTVSVMTSSFAAECAKYYSMEFFYTCHKTFDEFPVAYTLNQTTFVRFIF